VGPPRVAAALDPYAALLKLADIQNWELASFLPTPPARVAPERLFLCAMCGKTRSLNLVSHLPGTSNWVLPELQYTLLLEESGCDVAGHRPRLSK
jgi:hypothetical protein